MCMHEEKVIREILAMLRDERFVRVANQPLVEQIVNMFLGIDADQRPGLLKPIQ